MKEQGAKFVAVSDVQGGIFAEDGLDITSVCEHVSKTGSVVGMKGTRDIDNAELLTLDVELLIAAAASRSSRISWPTVAASRCPISSGFRTFSSSTGNTNG